MKNNWYKIKLLGGSMLVIALLGLAMSGARAVEMEGRADRGLELTWLAGDEDITLNAGAELEFSVRKPRKAVPAVLAWARNLFFDEYKNLEVKAELGQNSSLVLPLEVEYARGGRFRVKFPEKDRQFAPGLYSVELTLSDEKLTGGQTLSFSQDFSWGVLAYNSDKSYYQIKEEAFLQVAVLDDLGDTLCDAEVVIEIDEPGLGRTLLSTEDGSITRNSKCGPNNVIDEPDYFANFQIEKKGIYRLRISAVTDNGRFEIEDSFEAGSDVSYSVKRIGPTRIYPFADYPMAIEVEFGEDFSGDIVETVPAGFGIVEQKAMIKDQGSMANDQKSGMNDQEYVSFLPDSSFLIQDSGSERQLIWRDVKAKAGDILRISYVFDAPDIAPRFYLLGPLRADTGGIWEDWEGRAWQIAADATNAYGANAGYGIGLASAGNPGNAWDRTNNTYAVWDVPRRTNNDTANYLVATGWQIVPPAGTVTAVEIGAEGMVQDTNQQTVYLTPIFNGTATGTVQSVSGTDFGNSDNDAINWVTITTDAAGPGNGNWTWNHIQNLDMMLYGGNTGPQARTLSVDQLYVRVTYNEPATSTIISLFQKTDGSGEAALRAMFADPENNNLRAKLEYEAGTACAFTAPALATLSFAVTASSGAPVVDNNQTYRLGTTTGYILTGASPNYVNFAWDSQADLDPATGTYCVRLTAHDGFQDQIVSATGTVYIDHEPPQISAAVIPDLMYKVGDTVTATITVAADPDVYSLGSATINGKNLSNLQKINDTTYTARYTVASGDSDRATGTIPYSLSLRDPFGNANSAFSGTFSQGSIDANLPAITQVTAPDNNYKIGDTITLSIAVTADTDAYSLAASTLNGKDLFNLNKISDTAYSAQALVEAGDTDRAAGTIPLSLVLRDTYGNTNSAFTVLTGSAAIDANAPAVSAVYIANGTYKIGSNISVVINADAPGYGDGGITVNGRAINSFTDNGNNTYNITYTVVSGDPDRSAGTIPVSIVLADSFGNANAPYTQTEANTASVDANPPMITEVSIPDLVYKVGDALTATITVAADPDTYTLGASSINWATSSTGSLQKISNTTYTVTYQIAEGNTDRPAGTIPVWLVLADSLSQANAPYTQVAANTAAIDANSPAISAVSFSPSSGTLKVGDTATATITALNNETGLLPGPTLTINAVDVSATFTELGAGQYRLIYTVQEGDSDVSDAAGLAVNLSLADTAGNISAAYITADPDNRPGVDANSPAISAVSFSPSSGTLKVGDTATATITALNNETGLLPGPTLTINGVDVSATFSELGGGQYRSIYTVQEGNSDVSDAVGLSVNLTLADPAGNISSAYTSADPDNRPGADANSPSAPGSLAFSDHDNTSITLLFGDPADDANFSEYKIFYKQGQSGVTESDQAWTQADDPSLGQMDYDVALSTTISGLSAGIEYVFNIWAYDQAGNRTAAGQELAAWTNSAPSAAFALAQKDSDGAFNIDNGAWYNDNFLTLFAAANDADPGDRLTLYFEIASGTEAFRGDRGQACFDNEAWADCPARVWAVVSPAGDYSSASFASSVRPWLPDDYNGYKWQASVCDDHNACSAWQAFNASVPNFRIDNVPPTAPGNLVLNSKTSVSVTFDLTGTSSEANFLDYKIFYKIGSSGVTESDQEFSTADDPNLADIDFNGAATVTIGSLTAGTGYVFNIWAYDQAGNKAVAQETMVATESAFNPPVASFQTVQQKNDGSGEAVVSFVVSDPDNDDTVRARLEYEAGDSCQFLAPQPVSLDPDAASASVPPAPAIDNDHDYQVGSTSAWIRTSGGANTVTVLWLSQADIPAADGTYCLRLTANDGSQDQLEPATTTVYIDNDPPSAPGDLEAENVGTHSVWLKLGNASIDSNFNRYKIFYKIGTSGVGIGDTPFLAEDLLYQDYNGAVSLFLGGLPAGTDHAANIWAYDDLGNSRAAVEVSFRTNDYPALPQGLGQFRTDGITAIAGGAWTNENSLRLRAQALDPDPGQVLTLYFEIASSTRFFESGTSSPCAYNADWQDCPSRLWAVTSPAGDYAVTPFTGTVAPGNIPNEYTGLKWQVLACDALGACSEWTDAGIDSFLRVDHLPPQSPGGLSVAAYDSQSVTLNYGAPTVESNFLEYKIFYKAGVSGVSENDQEHSAADDPALAEIDLGGATSTIIGDLNAGTDYVFNIWAYDQAGNKASALEITQRTNSRPAVEFVSADLKRNGSGAVDVSFRADDPDQENLRAKLEYEAGIDCQFASPLKPTLNESDASATSTQGDAKVLNSQAYQIGTIFGWIETAAGPNTVSLDWLSQSDLAAMEGYYCLRLTVNDFKDSSQPATTTVYIDNQAPTAPGTLSLANSAGSSLTLQFGATSTDSNFSRYRIYYKQGVATVNENDPEHLDENLLDRFFNGAATTTVSDLAANTQYSFRVFAYDSYGNKSQSGQSTFTTNARPTGAINSALQKTDGSGRVDIAITAYDLNGDDLFARLEYEAGADCVFTAAFPAILDEDPAYISATYDSVGIDNGQEFQIGTLAAPITTFQGANTVEFDWLSQLDIPDGDGLYCLRLTVFDQSDVQLTAATSTVAIDNAPPTPPGALTVRSAGPFAVTLDLAEPGYDENFREYKIHYKKSLSGVTANDPAWTALNDPNLGLVDLGLAESTTVSGLDQDQDYVFNIWIYDQSGNKAAAAFEAATTTLIVPSATWREDEDSPDPTEGEYAGRDDTVRLRVQLANIGELSALDRSYGLQYVIKDGSCAAVSDWTDVPAEATSGQHWEMADSINFENQSFTSAQLSNDASFFFAPGYMIKWPERKGSDLSLAPGEYTELEYTIRATGHSFSSATYCFRAIEDLLPLDQYSAYPELQLSPPPIGEILSARQRTTGSGRVDIGFTAYDQSRDPLRARLEYEAGPDCIFDQPNKAYIDPAPVNVSAAFGTVGIDNNHHYQVGTSSAFISTLFGSNTVSVDWLSQNDLPAAEGEHCLRLIINDTWDDQIIPATTTLMIDNAPPSAPGDMSFNSKTINSVTFNLGTSSSDLNFQEYKIFYREGASGVTESDMVLASTTDPNLGYMDHNGAATATIAGLIENRQYVFRIWAYDQYGNKAASAGEISVKMVPTIGGAVYSDRGQDPLLDSSGVTIVIGGSLQYSTTAAADNGRFIFYEIDPPAIGTPIAVFISSGPSRGASYSLYGGAGDISDLDIYVDTVIVRHFNDGPLAPAHIDLFDRDQNDRIGISVSGISLSMHDGHELYVWPGSTFENGSGPVSLNDLRVEGVFEAVGEQVIGVNGSWYGQSGTFIPARSTVLFNSTDKGQAIYAGRGSFYTLEFDGSGGEWLLYGSATSTATTTISQGTFIQGAEADFETRSLTIAAGASFVKASGTGIFIFEGDGLDGFFEDQNSPLNDLGNVEIGYSPAVTRLNSNFSATSLTVNASDTFFTRGYDVTVSGFITINGTYNCTDDKAGDGTITSVGTNWTVAPGAVFLSANSTTTFSGSAASTISTGGIDANHRFHHLVFAKSAPATSTLAGYGLRAVGNVNIGADSAWDVSADNYAVYAAGDWLNNGVFAARQGTTTLETTGSGQLVQAGRSSFYNLDLNGSGSWVIGGHATTSNDLFINSASGLEIASGTWIEVGGSFQNRIADNSVDWKDSTLYLAGTGSYGLNGKTAGASRYGTLRLASGAHIKIWNSDAAAYAVDVSASLYSMDHGRADGDLYVWGAYSRTGGSEYWSNDSDFDGTDLSLSPRACRVRLADGASVSLDGADWKIEGAAGATTTVEVQTSGHYSLAAIDGIFSAQYFELRGLDEDGLQLSGAVDIAGLVHGDLELAVPGGALLSLGPEVLNANASSSFYAIRFATSTAISGYNVRLSGAADTFWHFAGAYGNLAGEAFDDDPGDPRGYIIWDDSPDYRPRSQNWRWYHDQDKATPQEPAADENTAPSSIGQNNSLKLRLTVNEVDGISGHNVKLRLQYSVYSDFSLDVFEVGEIGDREAVWAYAEGAGEDNAVLEQRLLSDSTANATHNRSGLSDSGYTHAALTPAEWEFTIREQSAVTGTTYYFRAYADYDNLFSGFSQPVLFNSGHAYPSLYVSGAVLEFSITGISQGVTVAEQVTDVSTTPGEVSFGNLRLDQATVAAQRFTLSSNAEYGYRLMVYERSRPLAQNGAEILPISATNQAPAPWPAEVAPSGYGYHTSDSHLSGLSPSRFASPNSYARFESDMREVAYSPIPAQNQTVDFVYKLEVTPLQSAGDYRADIVYVVIPAF